MRRPVLTLPFAMVLAASSACLESADNGRSDASDSGGLDGPEMSASFDIGQGDQDADEPGYTGFFDVDPSACAELATGVIMFRGLDSELERGPYAVVRSSGRFESTDEAIAELEASINDGTMPSLDFELVSTYSGGLERWSSPAADYGAEALTDTRLNEVVFAGTVIWAGGPDGPVGLPPTWSDGHGLRVTDVAAPDPPRHIPLIGYGEFPGDDVLREAWDWASRTDLVHAFAGCDDYNALVFTYAPAVGEIRPEYASAIVLITGTITRDWLPEP